MQQVVSTLTRNSLLVRDSEPEAIADDRLPEPDTIGNRFLFCTRRYVPFSEIQ